MLTDSDPNLTNSLRKSNKKRRFGKHINSPTIYVHIVVCTHIYVYHDRALNSSSKYNLCLGAGSQRRNRVYLELKMQL